MWQEREAPQISETRCDDMFSLKLIALSFYLSKLGNQLFSPTRPCIDEADEEVINSMSNKAAKKIFIIVEIHLSS